MEQEQQIERIEAWYTGRMSTNEKARFEADLASDEKLRALFEQHKYLLDGFEGMKVQSFAEKMRQSQAAYIPSGKNRTLWATVVIAASVIMLIGITYFISQPFGVQRLAREYYAAPLAEVQRSDTPGEDSFFQKGMLAFAQKDWDQAISAFRQMSTTDSDYPRGLYFEAHALVAGKRYAEALTLFTDTVFRNSPLEQQAEWNSVLMLMYLQYPTPEIRDALQRITNNPDHFYKNKATEVLNELEPD
jgi:tetratricopeptide (TPR) repeat protein